MDSFTVIPGLESQVTSPLALVQRKVYDARYGGLLGGLPRGQPAGGFEDPCSCGLGGGMFGDPQDVDGFGDARTFGTKAGVAQRIAAGVTRGPSLLVRGRGASPSTAPIILGPRYVGGGHH